MRVSAMHRAIIPELGHDRQGQIVAIAAFVIGLEGVAANRDGSAVGDVTEGAGDRRSRPIINHRKQGANWECARVDRAKE